MNIKDFVYLTIILALVATTSALYISAENKANEISILQENIHIQNVALATNKANNAKLEKDLKARIAMLESDFKNVKIPDFNNNKTNSQTPLSDLNKDKTANSIKDKTFSINKNNSGFVEVKEAEAKCENFVLDLLKSYYR